MITNDFQFCFLYENNNKILSHCSADVCHILTTWHKYTDEHVDFLALSSRLVVSYVGVALCECDIFDEFFTSA